jgi:hypothetical protein
MCHCGIPAQVKQSRDEATAGRAFYTCARKCILNENGEPSQYNIALAFSTSGLMDQKNLTLGSDYFHG